MRDVCRLVLGFIVAYRSSARRSSACLPAIFVIACGIFSAASSALAEDLNPSADKSAFRVAGLILEGFSKLDDYPVSLHKMQSLVKRERAKYPEQMTVDQLHHIADNLTVYIRRQGYTFHTVYLPPQDVQRGQVRLLLQEGRLGSVHVLNNTSWPDKRFSRPFRHLVGQMLYAPAVEERVFALKSQPGVSVFAFYSRGVEPGEARLNLRVDKAKKRSYSVKFENYGSEANGEYRGIAQYSEYQLTGHFDRLSLAVLQSLDSVSSTYGSIQYTLPLPGLYWEFSLGASSNQFDVGGNFAFLGMEGVGSRQQVNLTRYFRYKPGYQKSIQLGFVNKTSELTDQLSSGTSGSSGEDSSWLATLAWSWQSPISDQWMSAGRLELGQGQFTDDSVIDEPLTKLNIDYSLSRPASNNNRGAMSWSSVFRMQHTDQRLPGLEKASMSGAYGVRSVAPGIYSADRSWLISSDIAWPHAFRGEKARSWHVAPLVFMDWASAEKLDDDGDVSGDAQFGGLGVGVSFSVGKHLKGRLTYGEPIENSLSEDEDGTWLFEIHVY